MAVGPKDAIDQLLVKKYASEKVENHSMTKLVDSQKMLETMNDYALMHRNMLVLSQKLKDVCSGVNAKSAIYKTKKRVAAPTKA